MPQKILFLFILLNIVYLSSPHWNVLIFQYGSVNLLLAYNPSQGTSSLDLKMHYAYSRGISFDNFIIFLRMFQLAEESQLIHHAAYWFFWNNPNLLLLNLLQCLWHFLHCVSLNNFFLFYFPNFPESSYSNHIKQIERVFKIIYYID